jgi:hypothetical protein
VPNRSALVSETFAVPGPGRGVGILLTMTTMPLAEVKARLSEWVERAHAHHERLTVTLHCRPGALVAAHYFRRSASAG